MKPFMRSWVKGVKLIGKREPVVDVDPHEKLQAFVKAKLSHALASERRMVCKTLRINAVKHEKR